MGFGDEYNKKFTIVNNEAFTEDNVRVFNLFVHGLSAQTTNDDMKRYFKRFGAIVSTNIVRLSRANHCQGLKQIGFVNFVHAKDAASVLVYKSHYIKSKRIGVTACYSWQQPEEQIADQDSDNQQQKGISLLHLNDDCLEHLCSFLKLRDQIAFARTCRRFRDIFCIYSKLKYKVLDLEKLRTLTLWQARDFLEMVGPCIETLEGAIPNKGVNRIAESCGKHCVNVKTLNMCSMAFKPTFLKKFLHKMNSITEMDLLNVSLSDHSINVLQRLKNLKVLRVPLNHELTGQYFNNLVNVEELSLNGCTNIQSFHFIEMCKGMKNLRKLDIKRCERLGEKAFNELVQYGLNIETLKMSGMECPYECVAQLPKLKHYELLADTNFRTQIFEKLANYKSEQLETFTFTSSYIGLTYQNALEIAKLQKLKVLSCSQSENVENNILEQFAQLSELEELQLKNCRSFTNEGLLEIIKQCHKLKRLNIVKCRQITDRFVLEAIKVLDGKHQKQHRQEPLVIMASRSGISPFLKESSDLKEKEHIIQLSFQLHGYFDDLLHSMDDSYDMSDDDDVSEFDYDYEDELEELEFINMNFIDEYHNSDTDDDLYFGANAFGLYDIYDNFYDQDSMVTFNINGKCDVHASDKKCLFL